MTLLEHKVAIVTGASSGIGRATALLLASQGANIVLAARRISSLAEVADSIRAYGGKVLVIPTDVSVKGDVDFMVEKTLTEWGKVDILVANAGEYVRCPIEELSVDYLEHSMSVNFYGGVYSILAVLPHMRAQKSGHIILVTTMDAKKGLPQDAPYVSAKSALAGFGEVLRQELHGSGIYVTNVLPGRVDTEMIEEMECHWISAKIPSDSVARGIVSAIRRPRPELIVPFHASLLHYVNVFSPRMADWAVRFFHLEGWKKSEIELEENE